MVRGGAPAWHGGVVSFHERLRLQSWQAARKNE
jgi:hypothetical protein